MKLETANLLLAIFAGISAVAAIASAAIAARQTRNVAHQARGARVELAAADMLDALGGYLLSERLTKPSDPERDARVRDMARLSVSRAPYLEPEVRDRWQALVALASWLADQYVATDRYGDPIDEHHPEFTTGHSEHNLQLMSRDVRAYAEYVQRTLAAVADDAPLPPHVQAPELASDVGTWVDPSYPRPRA